jgi:hypothetical protein
VAEIPEMMKAAEIITVIMSLRIVYFPYVVLIAILLSCIGAQGRHCALCLVTIVRLLIESKAHAASWTDGV